MVSRVQGANQIGGNRFRESAPRGPNLHYTRVYKGEQKVRLHYLLYQTPGYQIVIMRSFWSFNC